MKLSALSLFLRWPGGWTSGFELGSLRGRKCPGW